jgi:hypothetical protein
MVRTINGSAYLFPGRPASRPRDPGPRKGHLSSGQDQRESVIGVSGVVS